MYEAEIIASFAAAHRLREYNGKCEHLHGHNYKIHVCLRGRSTGKGGMLMDFGEIKKATSEVLARLDHTFLNEIEPFTQEEPSAENIAAYLFREIATQLKDYGDLLHRVSVWESDSSRATFVKDEF